MKAKFSGVIFFVCSVLILQACVTQGDAPPEKWSPEERAEAHVDLGMIYLRRNQIDTANAEFDLAIETSPQYAPAYHAKGLLLEQIGNIDEATKSLARAVALDPSNYVATNDYAVHLCQQNKTADGIKLLERVDGVAENDQQLGTNLGLGVCYLNAKKYTLSEKNLQLVLEQSPTIPQALLPMAEIRFATKNFLSARGFLERYFGSGSISERSLYLATKVEAELKDFNKANQYRRELRKRYPQSIYNQQLGTLVQ